MDESQEAVLCNNILAGLAYYSQNADAQYYRALIHAIFVGEARKIDMFQVSLKAELDNIHPKLPPHWRYYFKYTSEKPKFGTHSDPLIQAEELFIDVKTDKRVWMVNKKIKNILESATLIEKARILALLSHAGLNTDYMQEVRQNLLTDVATTNNIKWILTADERYMRDDFVRTYPAWLFYLGA